MAPMRIVAVRNLFCCDQNKRAGTEKASGTFAALIACNYATGIPRLPAIGCMGAISKGCPCILPLQVRRVRSGLPKKNLSLQVHHYHYRKYGKSVIGHEHRYYDAIPLCTDHHSKGKLTRESIQLWRKAYRFRKRWRKFFSLFRRGA